MANDSLDAPVAGTMTSPSAQKGIARSWEILVIGMLGLSVAWVALLGLGLYLLASLAWSGL